MYTACLCCNALISLSMMTKNVSRKRFSPALDTRVGSSVSSAGVVRFTCRVTVYCCDSDSDLALDSKCLYWERKLDTKSMRDWSNSTAVTRFNSTVCRALLVMSNLCSTVSHMMARNAVSNLFNFFARDFASSRAADF